MARFWNLSKPFSMRGRAEWSEETHLNIVRCSLNPSHERAGGRATDLHVMLTSIRFTDLIWTWHSELMVQEHVLQAFREQGFTGFDIKPVHAQIKIREGADPFYGTPFADPTMGVRKAKAEGVEVPALWELAVTGWGGMAPPESGVQLNYHCPGCNSFRYTPATDPRFLIDEEQWDGSDFFFVWPYPCFIFVTDRVAKFLRKSKYTGFRLRQPRSLLFNTGGSPGRLSLWLPEDRAREIGEPLGIY